MIKVNLLPEKRRKKAIPFLNILIPGSIITGVTILILIIFAFQLNSKISALENEKTIKEKRLNELKEALKEVENYERDNKAFREKSRIIELLQKNQSVPLRLLDEVSERLPEGVWLTALVDKKGLVSLEGYAFTNSDLVGYVQNLKRSKYFTDVTLLESRQATFEDVQVYKFRLTFRIKV
jgi:type IV pilus assembly protein PilN